jgi:uncharacterized protein
VNRANFAGFSIALAATPVNIPNANQFTGCAGIVRLICAPNGAGEKMKSSKKLAYAALVGLASVGATSTMSHAAVVLNEVYGGGGNSGAFYRYDFVELYNNGSSAVDISGYQIDYGSASGTSAFSALGTDDSFSTIVPASTSLAPGAYYLFQEASGANTSAAALPGTFQVDATPIAMSSTTFRVQMTDSAGTVVDFVGVGPTASQFEGTGPAPVIANTTSDMRIPNGTDTNQNATDFSVGAPTPNATNAVPEPTTLGLAAAAGALVIGRRRR